MYNRPIILLLAWATLAGAQISVREIIAFDKPRVIAEANLYINQPPITITAFHSEKSTGGRHDFFSEADYWWPDPANPAGPYIQRDGMSNPANFVEHRRALMRFSQIVPSLTSAWKLTGDPRYAAEAIVHLRAWFVDPSTRMNPNLQYAQAIHGRATGRGIGIIDTIHLVEIARAVEALESAHLMSSDDARAIRIWFGDYLQWMTTSPHGIEERDAKNNHATCWVMQVAAFAHLTGNTELLKEARTRFETVLVPNQMAADGSFPLEMKRTKPYSYSLFNLEAMATICRILSGASGDLWDFQTPDGKGLRKSLSFYEPYIRDKSKWPLAPDVMYADKWPMRQSSLLFGGLAYSEPAYINLWRTLPATSDTDEVIRNFFIRQPVLWLESPSEDGIIYGAAGGEKLTMDYYPPKGAGVHPIAIIIHGGGYQRGDSKSGSEAYCADFLAPAGYAVFSINYRLAPKYPYPDMVHDVERAVRYLRHNGKRWNADPNHIALVGGSAGGFLSNMVGLLNAPGDPNAADPVDRESAAVNAVVTLFAQSSFATLPLNKDVHALLDPLIQQEGEAKALRDASPITYVTKNAPPFLLIQGDKDEYIPYSEDTNLQTALRSVGARCDLIRIPGGTHGTGGWNKLANVPDWEREMIEWLNARFDHTGQIGEGIRQRIPPK